MRSLGVLFAGVLLSLSAAGKAKPVRVLTWWDYLSPEVLQRAEKAGVRVDLSLYKSNEVAFSRLISKKNSYDVAVVSGVIVDSISPLIDFGDIRKELGKQEYIKFLEKSDSKCIPYLWSATVFTVIGDEKVQTLQELIELKKKNYSIAIIDDPLEIFARSILDHNCSVGAGAGASLWSLNDKCLGELKELKSLQAQDLKTSTAEFLTKHKSASYGWHGEVKPLLTQQVNLNMYLPPFRPVVGADYVCVLKKALKNKNVLEFVKLLTDREGIRMNMVSTGYFSPYRNHTIGLEPMFANLYKEIMTLPADKAPVMMSAPSDVVHKQINQIFRKIRYEEK